MFWCTLVKVSEWPAASCQDEGMDLKALKANLAITSSFAKFVYSETQFGADLVAWVDRKGAAIQQTVLARAGINRLMGLAAAPEAVMKKDKAYNLLTAIHSSMKKACAFLAELQELAGKLPMTFEAVVKAGEVKLLSEHEELYKSCVEAHRHTSSRRRRRRLLSESTASTRA